MTAESRPRQKSTDHTLKVLDYAEQAHRGENVAGQFVNNVIILAAVFHDVGIPESLKRHGSSARGVSTQVRKRGQVFDQTAQP